MVSFLPHKQNFFHFIGQSVFGSRDINCRVPQGSISGPLLSLLYINDIPQALSYFISVYGQYWYFLSTSARYGIRKSYKQGICESAQIVFDNKMPIHFGEDKTKCMLFSKEKSGRRLTLSLTGTHCAGSSTDLPSNSNISKTVRVNIRV